MASSVNDGKSGSKIEVKQKNTTFCANIRAGTIGSFNTAPNIEINKTFSGKAKTFYPVEKEPAIPQEILGCCEPLCVDCIYEVAENLTKWRNLGRNLTGCPLPEDTLNQIKLDCEGEGVREIVVKVLRTWQERQPELATVGNLAKVLKTINKSKLALQLQPYLNGEPEL